MVQFWKVDHLLRLPVSSTGTLLGQPTAHLREDHLPMFLRSPSAFSGAGVWVSLSDFRGDEVWSS